MNDTTFNLWWTRTLAAVRADPKKTLFLAVLLVVLGVVWMRVMSGGSDGPKKAAASALPAPSHAPKVTSSRHDAGAEALRKWLASPIAPLERDLFAIKLDYYPQDGAQIAKTLRAPSGDGFWDQLAKSMTAKADQIKERRILVENLRLQAAQLKLQTTLMGRHPRAMVNGELVKEGDVVASFRVLAIEPRRIIVEREGVKLEILMN
jgi:hypothetical protein